MPNSGVRSRPIESDVLARPALAIPLEAERVRLVCRRFPVGGHAAGTRFTTASGVHLHALPWRCRRAAARLGTRLHLAGNLSSPRRQVLVDVKIDVREFHPAYVADEIRRGA